MKTPREILLHKHQSAESSLDAIRSASVHGTAVGGKRSIVSAIGMWLRDWLWPAPPAWAGIAVTWVVIAFLNLSTDSELPSATTRSAPTPTDVAELREQKRLFADLMRGEGSEPEARPPGPRSEYQRRSIGA